MYKFLEEKLRIEPPREKIELQRIHRLSRPNSLKPRPMIARFLRYSDRELVRHAWTVLVNISKAIKIFMSWRTYRKTYTSSVLKLQMKKIKEAREKGYKAYFSKANPDKLFVKGKYVAPDQPL